MSTIDLDIGEPEESPSQRRRRIKRSDGESAPKPKPTEKDDRSLVGRLDTLFTRIADQMEARGDEELSVAIKEERHSMSQGLVSLTANLTPFRPLLLLILALVEPFLAFWRVGRILFFRFLNWRASRPVPPVATPEDFTVEPSGIVT